MTLSYSLDEMSLPSDASLEDLDWVGFSWSLLSKTRNMGAQFVLAPGAFMYRMVSVRNWDDPFSSWSKLGEVSRFCQTDIREPDYCVLDEAVGMTNFLLNHYQCKPHWSPFLCDFTVNNRKRKVMKELKEQDSKLECRTLGDVIIAGKDPVLKKVFNTVTRSRPSSIS